MPGKGSQTGDAVPNAARKRFERGRELRAEGREEEAAAEFLAATELAPAWAEAFHQLGNALKALRRYAEAAASLHRAAELAPEQAAIWLNLGVACLELRLFGDAVAVFRRAIELEPGRPESHNVLGHALLMQGRCAEARRSLEEALRLRPGYAAAHNNLARVLKAQGRAYEALAHHRATLEGSSSADMRSNWLYALNFPPGLDPDEVFAEHRLWARHHAPSPPPAPPAPAPAPGVRLRVGYVSPDFVNHAVAYFIEGVLAAHDRDRFEIFCYSNAPVPDATTRRLRALAEHWRDVADWSDDRLAEAVREDRIDLLVDLAGHTARNRLPVFARRPAPAQATWLGYPNTTGLDAIDFRITDAICDPPGSTERWHSEKLVRLPEHFSCYRPPETSPPVGPLPALASGAVTFGCCNNLAKVNPPVIDLWARVLGAAPGSRLFLKSRGLADRETAAAVAEAFAQHGVGPERLELDGEDRSVEAHLQLYHRIDIALDTFPYNGATTTCEALWMGVPVVALAGRTHAGRVGLSLLSHLGVPEWAGATPDDYAAIAIGLASDLPRLAMIRGELRERMRLSPVCDAPRFTRQLERAFLTCAGRGG